MTGDIERVATVERVQSLATANIVRSLPAGPEDGETAASRCSRCWATAIDQEIRGAASDGARRPAARGDLVSEDGTVTALVVTFDEDRIDDVRAGVIERNPRTGRPATPAGHARVLNGSLEISETYNRVTLANTRNLTPRSWR